MDTCKPVEELTTKRRPQSVARLGLFFEATQISQLHLYAHDRDMCGMCFLRQGKLQQAAQLNQEIYVICRLAVKHPKQRPVGTTSVTKGATRLSFAWLRQVWVYEHMNHMSLDFRTPLVEFASHASHTDGLHPGFPHVVSGSHHKALDKALWLAKDSGMVVADMWSYVRTGRFSWVGFRQLPRKH